MSVDKSMLPGSNIASMRYCPRESSFIGRLKRLPPLPLIPPPEIERACTQKCFVRSGGCQIKLRPRPETAFQVERPRKCGPISFEQYRARWIAHSHLFDVLKSIVHCYHVGMDLSELWLICEARILASKCPMSMSMVGLTCTIMSDGVRYLIAMYVVSDTMASVEEIWNGGD